MPSIIRHRDLLIWQQSIALAGRVYAACRPLHSVEQADLRREIERCAIAVPSRIAEGSARATRQEFLEFLQLAQQQLALLETQLTVAAQQGWVALPAGELREIGALRSLLEKAIERLRLAPLLAHARACTGTAA